MKTSLLRSLLTLFLHCSPPPLQAKMINDVFTRSGLVDMLHVPAPKFKSFIAAVMARYRAVPYHNVNHALHVMHTCWMVSQ